MIAVVLFTLISTNVAAQPWEICGTTGKYATGSAYDANLDLLSTALPANASSIGRLFAKGSVGAVPDAVHGLVLCRGDLNASACRSCLAGAFQGSRRLCALAKDAAIFYDTCLLRYSDQDFLALLDSISSSSSSNRSNASAGGDAVDPAPLMITEAPLMGWDGYSSNAFITQQVRIMLNSTIRQLFASTPRRSQYAAVMFMGDLDGSNTLPPLYAYAQCTPDLVDDLCYSCLQNFSDLAVANIARRAGRVLGLRCNLRYEDSSFYGGHLTVINANGGTPNNPTPLPPSPTPKPAPLPPSRHKKLRPEVLVIVLVSPLLALFICVVVSFGFIRRHIKGRGDKAKMNLQGDEALIWGVEGRSSDFLIYEFSQILEATCNFSEENKLGQGGFGPVYKTKQEVLY